MKLNKHEEAIQYFEKAIKFDTNNLEAYNAKGASLIKLN